VLEPGKKLNERELCETLGISRTPLREALKVLAAEGLIEISPNRGASVSKMSEAELRETFELMSGLEAFSGELAAERMTAAELAEIKALHYAMLACRTQNDLAGYYSRNQAIHDKINEAARNSALRQTYVAVNRRCRRCGFGRIFRSLSGIVRFMIMMRC
jgi:Transcriptional regulators